MGNLSDEKLIKRASYAGRNISMLALLASFGAAAVTAATCFLPQRNGLLVLFAAAFCSVATGYWLLAVAAKRGNIRAVEVVIAFMALQMAFGVGTNVVWHSAPGTQYHLPLGGFVIPFLILLALIGNRSTLAELYRRGLWFGLFGAARPSGLICGFGAVLLVLGMFGFLGGGMYVGRKMAGIPQDRLAQARAYTAIIQDEERAFLSAVDLLADGYTPDDLTIAQKRVYALEQAVEELRVSTAGNRELAPVLETYRGAVQAWRAGVDLLLTAPLDSERARAAFEKGIALRERAARDFDARFASNQSRPAETL